MPGQPLSRWRLPDWERHLDGLRSRGHDRVWLLLNGYTLGYPSAAYPGLRDPEAEAVRNPGLVPAIVAAAHGRGLKALAVFATDGHAVGLAAAHPELKSVNRDGSPVSDDAVCLEEPAVGAYLNTLFVEAWNLCQDWDGVVLHPTEASPLRFNAVTRDQYRAETGRDLMAESDETVLLWCNQQYAHAVTGWFKRWEGFRPGGDLVMFNCRWTNASVATYRDLLPPRARVGVWDYDWRGTDWRTRPLVGWTAAFGPERITYMPSGGGYPEDGRPPGEAPLRGYRRLFALAAYLRVPEVVFFAGWGTGGEAHERVDRTLLDEWDSRATPIAADLDAFDREEAGRG